MIDDTDEGFHRANMRELLERFYRGVDRPWIECDGELIDSFRVVSREVLEVAPLDQGIDAQPSTLYPAGFSARAFVEVIVGEHVWPGLLPD